MAAKVLPGWMTSSRGCSSPRKKLDGGIRNLLVNAARYLGNKFRLRVIKIIRFSPRANASGTTFVLKIPIFRLKIHRRTDSADIKARY